MALLSPELDAALVVRAAEVVDADAAEDVVWVIIASLLVGLWVLPVAVLVNASCVVVALVEENSVEDEADVCSAVPASDSE